MEEYKEIDFNISIQGKIVVNDAIIISENADVVLVQMDLKSKYAEIMCIGSDGGIPMITLEATADTLIVDENNDSVYTEILFPSLDGWDIWAHYLGRYTLNICFIKED